MYAFQVVSSMALGGAAIVVTDEHDVELEVREKSSPLYGTRVTVPSGALPEGVRSAVLSVLPDTATSNAPYRPQTDGEFTIDGEEGTFLKDNELPAFRLEMVDRDEQPIDSLEKDLEISQRLPPSRGEFLRNAVEEAVREDGGMGEFCDLLKEAAELRAQLDELALASDEWDDLHEEQFEESVREARKALPPLGSRAGVTVEGMLEGTGTRTDLGVYMEVPEGYTVRMGAMSEQAAWSTAGLSVELDGSHLEDTKLEPGQSCRDRGITWVIEKFFETFPPAHRAQSKDLGTFTPIARVTQETPSLKESSRCISINLSKDLPGKSTQNKRFSNLQSEWGPSWGPSRTVAERRSQGRRPSAVSLM